MMDPQRAQGTKQIRPAGLVNKLKKNKTMGQHRKTMWAERQPDSVGVENIITS